MCMHATHTHTTNGSMILFCAWSCFCREFHGTVNLPLPPEIKRSGFQRKRGLSAGESRCKSNTIPNMEDF